MANIYPDQEIDPPLWCNTGAPLVAGGEIPPLPCHNSTALSGGADPSPKSIVYSILVYVAVMLLVLLPLCPCFRCEERDYRDTKRYIKKRKADILEDVITKPAQEHNASDGIETTKEEASTHGTFEIGDLDDDADDENVVACVSIDVGGPSLSIDATDVSSSSAMDVMAKGDTNQMSHSQHSSATSGGKLVCSICLEAFAAGEEVSWSRNKECTHCYHQECISQWLIKHDECPVCRNDYLFDDWKYNQLPPPEPPLFCILLRRPPRKCTCAAVRVEDAETEKRTNCVFCVIHGLESPSGTALCEGTSAGDEESGGKLKDIDLEAGEGGLKCEEDDDKCCNDPAPEIKTVKEEPAKPCPVHGRRGNRTRQRRNRPTNTDDDSNSAHWYEDRLRETWWAMSSRHLGMRLEDSPSYAARSQFT